MALQTLENKRWKEQTDNKIEMILNINEQFLTDLKKHNAQYPEIEFIQLPQRNHDRFLIIDDKVYFVGASLKDIGTGLCAVSEMTITPDSILKLLNHSVIE